MTTATEEHTLEEVICWINAWANEHKHMASVKPGQTLSREWRAGYEKACSEIMDKLTPLTDDWLEAWREGKWRRLGS